MKSIKNELIGITFLFLSFSVVSDELTTQLTQSLNGTEITYNYSGGMSFNVKFNEKNLIYRALSTQSPLEWHGPFSYKEILTENGEYFVSWFEEKSIDYITLLIDLEEKRLYGSGLIGAKYIHFEKAKIIKVE